VHAPAEGHVIAQIRPIDVEPSRLGKMFRIAIGPGKAGSHYAGEQPAA
jgi:hypothetical protein